MATSWVRGASLKGTVWHTRRTQVAASGSRLMRRRSARMRTSQITIGDGQSSLSWVLELCRDPLRQPGGLQEAPEENVRVGEKLQDPKASYSLSGTGGETMSPVILPVALKEPNQEAGLLGGGGGTICAIGSPLRVTRIGLPVRFTLANRARQVALNLEIETSSSMAYLLLLWSWTIVN